MQTETSNVEVFALIARLEWNDFEDSDYQSFSGVISKTPLIAEDEELQLIYVLDDQVLQVLDSRGNVKKIYTLRATEAIRAL
jgi:hypothetical protein